MNSDSHKIADGINMSPLKLKVFLPCFFGMVLFVFGIVVGRSLPATVQISDTNISAVGTNNVKAHGRFGSPRWVQPRTLVADAETSESTEPK